MFNFLKPKEKINIKNLVAATHSKILNNEISSCYEAYQAAIHKPHFLEIKVDPHITIIIFHYDFHLKTFQAKILYENFMIGSFSYDNSFFWLLDQIPQKIIQIINTWATTENKKIPQNIKEEWEYMKKVIQEYIFDLVNKHYN